MINLPLLAPASNLKALYHGGDTVDSSGNGFTLTNNNSVTFTPSKFGNGSNFGTANTNKSMSIANNLGITGNVITIAAFVKMNTEVAAGVYELFLHESTTTNVSYNTFYDYNAGAIRLGALRVREGTGTDVSVYRTGALGTNDINRVILTCDGTNLRLFFNGALVGTSGAIGAAGSGGTNIFRFGGSAGYGWSNSTMSEVAVYDVAVDPVAIRREWQSFKTINT